MSEEEGDEPCVARFPSPFMPLFTEYLLDRGYNKESIDALKKYGVCHTDRQDVCNKTRVPDNALEPADEYLWIPGREPDGSIHASYGHMLMFKLVKSFTGRDVKRYRYTVNSAVCTPRAIFVGDGWFGYSGDIAHHESFIKGFLWNYVTGEPSVCYNGVDGPSRDHGKAIVPHLYNPPWSKESTHGIYFDSASRDSDESYKNIDTATNRLVRLLSESAGTVKVSQVPAPTDHRLSQGFDDFYAAVGPEAITFLKRNARTRQKNDASRAIRMITSYEPPCSTDAMFEVDPLPPHLIENFMPAETTGELTGAAAISKSTTLLRQCISIATGESHFGFPCQQGQSVFIAAEDNEKVINNLRKNLMLAELEFRREVEPDVWHKGSKAEQKWLEDIRTNLILLPMRGLDVGLLRYDRAADTNEVSDFAYGMMDNLSRFPDLKHLVLDHRGRFGGVDIETSNYAASAFIQLTEQVSEHLGTNIIFPSHISKGALTSKDLGYMASRGSSAVPMEAKASYGLATIYRPNGNVPIDELKKYVGEAPVDPANTYLLYTATKVNQLAPEWHNSYVIERSGFLMQRVYPRGKVEDDEATRLKAALRVVMEAAVQTTEYQSEDGWFPGANKLEKHSKTKSSTMGKYLKLLRENGLIEDNGGSTNNARSRLTASGKELWE